MGIHHVAYWHERKAQACFAAVRVRTADGPPQRIRDKGQQHLPGDEAWLIGEHRSSGEKKYYLANLPGETNLRTPTAIIKARWICEQTHQQIKEELGLDHFEGRSLARPSPTRADDNDRLRLPSKSSPHPSEAGEKESTDRHLSQACLPCVTPSSTTSCDRCSDARTAEYGFGLCGLIKSAKVVLARAHKKARTRVARFQQQGRRAKFYRAVLRAWSDARVLGQTETGPTARFLCAVSEGVSLHLTGRGAKEIIKREQKRRRTLKRLEQKYPIINAAATFDEAAQRPQMRLIGINTGKPWPTNWTN